MKIATVELSSVAEVQMGTAPAGSSYNSSGEGVPLIAGAGDYGDRYPVSKKWTTEATRLAKRGDLIVCVRATIGDLNWADREYCLGRGVAGVRPDPTKLNADYLAQYMAFAKDSLAKLGTGSTFPAIRRADLDTFPIPLPPLSEQKRIAEILDRAEALRAKRRAALALLDELTQSIFFDMFGDVTNSGRWVSRPLGETLHSTRPISYGILKPGDYHEDGVIMLRIQDIRGGNVSTNGLHRVSQSLSNQYKRTLLSGSEVLISLVGTIGLCALVPPEFAGANVHRNLAVIVPAEALEPRFVYKCMASAQFQRLVKETTKGGNQGLLNLGDLKRLPIPVPPFDLQRKFVAIDESLDEEKKRLRRHLGELDQLFASLQYRAFRGEL